MQRCWLCTSSNIFIWRLSSKAEHKIQNRLSMFLKYLRVHAWDDWTYGQTIFSISLKFAGRLPLALKPLEQRDFSRSLRSPLYQHAPPKWPKHHPIFGLENECYHSAQEWNTNETSSLQHLFTLVLSKNLKTLTSALSWKNLGTTPGSN